MLLKCYNFAFMGTKETKSKMISKAEKIKQQRIINILVAAGGTGGHLFPALAVVDKLQKIIGYKVIPSFVGINNKIESKVIPQLGFNFTKLPISGFTGVFSINSYLLPFKIFRSIFKCRSLIKKLNIDVCLCTGAYLSYPAGIAAYKEHIPIVLMESNVFPGKTIKLLSSKADLIITSFKESEKYFPSSLNHVIKYLGNPVRSELLSLPPQELARARFGLDPQLRTILIFGGSLGARSINNSIIKLLPIVAKSNYQVLWQIGNNFTVPKDIPSNVKVLNFIDDMASAYSASDLVVSRSGATTVAELCVVAKPSILVPLPSASNNEQESNANVLHNKGAAIMLLDYTLDEYLLDIINELIEDPKKLSKMGKAAKSLAKPDAADYAAQSIFELVKMHLF